MNLSNMDRLLTASIDLVTGNLTYKNLEFFLPDSNIFLIELTLNVGKTPLVNADLITGYIAKLVLVKPKTNEYMEYDGVIDGDTFAFVMDDGAKDQVGSYAFEFLISKDDETLVSKPGKFTVKHNIISGLNAQITSNPDYEILRQLINDVKAVVDLTPDDPDSIPFLRKPSADGGKGQVLTLDEDEDGNLINVWSTVQSSGGSTVNVVNNLTSTSTNSALSANQGRILNNNIGTLNSLTTTVKTDVVSAINELDNDKLEKSDVINNVTSTDTDKALSANQGKVLQDEIGTLSTLTTTAKTNTVSAINELDKDLGNLTTLTTTSKDNLVSAINEHDTEIGVLTDLTTTEKTNLVGALNELVEKIDNAQTGGTVDLTSYLKKTELSTTTISVTTSTKTIPGSINELDSDVGDKSTLTTTVKTDIVSAVNELDGEIGNLTTLTTTAKDTIVNAINEHDKEIGDLSKLETDEKTEIVKAINEVDGKIGEKGYYKASTDSDALTIVADDIEPSDTQIKLSDANINGGTFVVGDKVKYVSSTGVYLDIVDNLTTNNPTKALSAKQGKVLNDLIGDIQTILDSINGEVI